MSLRSRNAHGQVTRAILCEILQGKCRTPSPKELFYLEIDKKNAAHPSRGPHFVRACVLETHMDISQEQFCVANYREKAGPPGNTSIDNGSFYSYRKNPFSVATLFQERLRNCARVAHNAEDRK